MSDVAPYPESAAEREAAQSPPEAAFRYASWGRRAAPYILDALIVIVALTVVITASFAIAFVNEAVGIVALIFALVFLLGFPIWYYVYFVGNDQGQTLGRRALGLRVVDHRTAGRIGYGRAFGRLLITYVFGFLTIPLIFDYLWPLWDGRNQTLHDKAVSSVVVRV